MLTALGSGSAKAKEVRSWIIGRVIGLLCHITGWFMPMYFAGRLESGNVKEYEDAADDAGKLGLVEFASDLRTMASVERDHELFFASMVERHRLLPLMRSLFGWGPPGLTDTESEKAEV